ncbi:hypothetical protein DB88DRAFT_475095 [Papiliotrema laurentii]|uniref:Uncharacterized protein n=1 Tax=Papiliotrema laurentii TaxID=5418 RepID=A0AAD9FPY5_PAPLA|nr:hypothetical protein DB88DRAFT_475095 [Papiliotrema laurentii]
MDTITVTSFDRGNCAIHTGLAAETYRWKRGRRERHGGFELEQHRSKAGKRVRTVLNEASASGFILAANSSGATVRSLVDAATKWHQAGLTHPMRHQGVQLYSGDIEGSRGSATRAGRVVTVATRMMTLVAPGPEHKPARSRLYLVLTSLGGKQVPQSLTSSLPPSPTTRFIQASSNQGKGLTDAHSWTVALGDVYSVLGVRYSQPNHPLCQARV